MELRTLARISAAALLCTAGAQGGGEIPSRIRSVGARASWDRSTRLGSTSWSINAPIPEPLGVAQGAVVASADGSRIYHIGGITGAMTPTKKVWVYSPADDTWSEGADLPVTAGIRTFGAAAAVELNGFIYIFGGVSGTQSTGIEILNSTWIYDEANDSWSHGANMPGFRFGPAVATDGVVIWVMGGYNEFQGQDNTVWRYDPKADAYSTGFANMPWRLGRIHGAWLPAGSVHIFGGEPAWNYHLVYDTAADA